jgi:hypothetical protein
MLERLPCALAKIPRQNHGPRQKPAPLSKGFILRTEPGWSPAKAARKGGRLRCRCKKRWREGLAAGQKSQRKQSLFEDRITSHGPSGIGFVNFGVVHELKVNAVIETFGQGARGFNVYAGTVNLAEFDRLVTHADGAVGIQISQPIGRLLVRRGIETFGGTGQSLVKGVVLMLSAIGLSIKPGGSAREIEIAGGIKTNGPGVAPIEQHGAIDSLRVTGGFVAAGGGFDKI